MKAANKDFPLVLNHRRGFPAEYLALRFVDPDKLSLRSLDDLRDATEGTAPDGKATSVMFAKYLIGALAKEASEEDPVALYIGEHKVWDSINGRT